MDKRQPDQQLEFEDTTDFAAVYARHVGHVYRYLLARVGNPQDAEDLTAQTFTSALKSLKRYRGDGSLAAWLTVIARNHAVNRYRRHRRRREVALTEESTLSTPATDEIVGARLQTAALLAALNRLSADRAEVIRLRIFGGLSTAETAQVMRKSEAAVKMLLHRALHDLRQFVGEDQTP